MQLIQFASHSEKLNSKQSLRNQQLQQDNQQLQQDNQQIQQNYQQIQNDSQQRINTLDDVRQELTLLKSDLDTVTTERDSLNMENEELLQNNQSLAIERNDLKDEVAHLESRLTSHNQKSETSTTEPLTDDHFTYGFPSLRPADYVRTADLETQVRIKGEEILTLHSELTNVRRLLGNTEQEVFQLQSANTKLQLQLQTTKESIQTSSMPLCMISNHTKIILQ
jgi:hypothetical protein